MDNIDRQINRKVDRIDRWKQQIHKEIDRSIDRQMDRQIDRQINGQMDTRTVYSSMNRAIDEETVLTKDA